MGVSSDANRQATAYVDHVGLNLPEESFRFWKEMLAYPLARALFLAMGAV